eukprot:s80_g20.t1
MQLSVALPSGRSEQLSIPESSKVGDLKFLAHNSFAQGFLRLVTPQGHFLTDPAEDLQAAGLQDGDHLAAVVLEAKLAATERALALWCRGGERIVTWGDADSGGDSSKVQGMLRNVQQVGATSRAFAAILADGSVVAWGSQASGGDSSNVQTQLKSVQKIQATQHAFAAIRADGSVITWGKADHGGDSRQVKDQLRNVQHVQATCSAFAAILTDGSVVAWGDPRSGGNAWAVHHHLKNVQHIQATCSAFAAILQDGSVVAWGNPHSGGNSFAVQDQLRSVRQLQATNCVFAAIRADGFVVTWGSSSLGGKNSAVKDRLRCVQQVQATWSAFAAILSDGSVVTWGSRQCGGDSSAVQDQLRNVQEIQATAAAFAAILADKSVVTWGDADGGGDTSAVRDQLRNVQSIQATKCAFAAIPQDGSVITWGDRYWGGKGFLVQAQVKNLHPFQQIQAGWSAFAAILSDGSVVTWGDQDWGGERSEGAEGEERFGRDRSSRPVRPVSNRKALTQPRGKRDRPEVLSDGHQATLKRSFGPESLILLDPDAAFLEASDPSDSDVAKLLSNVWQCQVLASVCCALCQALLAGLSIASLLLVTLPTEELLAFSARLWPFFGGTLLILAEVCTFGSVLSVARLLWILQASRTGDEPPSGVRRRLLFAVLHATLNTSLLAVLAVVSCQVTWPESEIFLAEGLLGLAALLLSLPEAVQLMSSSPRRVFDK